MQLNNADQLAQVAKNCNFSIFELPDDIDFAKLFDKSIHIAPAEDKAAITIEQIRNIGELISGKQSSDLFIVVEQAEKMGPNAANAFLKMLEEPGEHTHYVFLTHNASEILPTIKSRANNYYLPSRAKSSDKPNYSEDIIALAKSYISAGPQELPSVVEKIIKFNKDSARSGATIVLACAIELCYKSYLITGNKSFLQKLEKVTATADNIAANGHIKLQLIAGML